MPAIAIWKGKEYVGEQSDIVFQIQLLETQLKHAEEQAAQSYEQWTRWGQPNTGLGSVHGKAYQEYKAKADKLKEQIKELESKLEPSPWLGLAPAPVDEIEEPTTRDPYKPYAKPSLPSPIQPIPKTDSDEPSKLDTAKTAIPFIPIVLAGLILIIIMKVIRK